MTDLTHPSAVCDCDTCRLEHSAKPDELLHFAVNPHTGMIIAMHPTQRGWTLEFVHHRACGRPTSAHRHYTERARADYVFWLNAEHRPPAVPR